MTPVTSTEERDWINPMQPECFMDLLWRRSSRPLDIPSTTTTTDEGVVQRWFDWGDRGDVIRVIRFPKMTYSLTPKMIRGLDFFKLEAMLNHGDVAFVCGDKHNGVVLMTQDYFHELTSAQQASLEEKAA